MLVLLSVGLISCGESTKVASDPPAPVDPTRVYVEQLLPELDDDLRQHAEAVAVGKALETILSREVRRSWNARVADGIKYADLFERIYKERDYHKVFARSDGLTPAGQAVLEVLLDAERHALDPSPYHVARIQTLVSKLEQGSKGEPTWSTIKLDGSEAEGLVRWMKKHDLEPHKPATRSAILDAMVGAKVDVSREGEVLSSPAPRITSKMDAFLEAFDKNAEANAELELRTADGALRYARDMKHFNLARQDWRDLRDAGGSKALIYGRLEQTFDALATADARETLGVLEGLEPEHPQYDKLVGGLQRYRAIAAEGGWPEVRRTSIEPGHKSPRVGVLRERLAAEGYLPRRGADRGARAPDSERDADSVAPGESAGAAESRSDSAGHPDAEPGEPDANVVDEALVSAVKSYQITHQFDPDADPTPGFWRSLNVPVEERIEQIELAIQRWRESHYMGESEFIMVNIPDFHAEVYRDGERQMRFRVVTGNNKRVCDEETGEWTYPNATPVMMAELDHVIVNPYWYVPGRIIREELEPKLESNPDYLEEKNYERVQLGGKETIRQKPGDENALGRVKFIFPNRHNVYMHDTPHKKYFDFPVRDYSHGCIRVHKPRELGEYLLAHDPAGTGYELEKLIEKGDQKYIELDKKIPVFLEYYTVRVDEQGRLNFLADIYHSDRVRLAEDSEEAVSCKRARRSSPPEPVQDADESEPEGVDSDLGP
ncbi:MAG: L,D-transpeptidase family protein [Myxococcota bacterium]